MKPMRRLAIWSFAALLGAGQPVLAASQDDLLCRATDDPDGWIESIRISPSHRKVWLKTSSYDSAQELALLHFNDGDDAHPEYAFNASVAGANIVNAFRVFRVAEQWRVISAGMEERQGTLVLLALGSSVKLACKAMAPAR